MAEKYQHLVPCPNCGKPTAPEIAEEVQEALQKIGKERLERLIPIPGFGWQDGDVSDEPRCPCDPALQT